MGTLTSTINLASPDSLPFVLNSTYTTAGTTGNFSEMGVLKLVDINYGISSSAFLSPKAIGPNGAFVFVQNPSTNTYKIKLYGAQQVEEEIMEETIDGIQPFATLKPGDSTLVPLSPQQYEILAVSTFGDSTLNYYIADRGGEFGKSILFLDDSATNWNYIMADAELGETLPVINTTNASRDLGLAVADWSHVDTYMVNNKGYCLKFYDNISSYKFVFINSRGEFSIHTDNVAYNEVNTLDELGLALVDTSNGSYVFVILFNGDNFTPLSIPGSNGNIAGSFDTISSDGSILLAVSDYLGVSGDLAYILLNQNIYHVLSNINSASQYVDDSAIYIYGNFIFLTIYDDDYSRYNTIQIWNTKGEKLHDIDISSYDINALDYWMYGSNKMQIIMRDNNDSNNVDYLLNYNGTTNKLIGFDAYEYSLDANNGLTWTHDRGTNYNSRLVYAYSKYPTDSIRPWNYTWNSGLYDAESIAILYANDYQNDPGYHVNSIVDFCDIVYVLDGQTDYSTYVFADDETKYIRIPNDGGGDFRITPSSNLIAFTYGVDYIYEGPLNALLITKTGVTTTQLLPELSDIENGNNDIYIKPVGDYIMYNWYNSGPDNTTYAMVKGGVKDTVNITGDSRYDGVWRMRVNSLLLRSWNYPSTRNWYFNTTTNKFVELTAGGASFSATAPYYPQHYFNKSTTTNGLNDGNILLGPWGNNNIDYTNNNIRLLKKGTVTANAILPSTDGSWEIYLGSEAVFFLYQDPDDSYNYKLKVYDLNLTLKQTISIGSSDYDWFEIVGKRCIIKHYNGSTNTFYSVSLKDAVKFTKDSYSDSYINDKYWWNYVY